MVGKEINGRTNKNKYVRKGWQQNLTFKQRMIHRESLESHLDFKKYSETFKLQKADSSMP